MTDAVGEVHKIFSSLRSGWTFSKSDWEMAEVINKAENQLVGVVQRLSRKYDACLKANRGALKDWDEAETKKEEAEGKLERMTDSRKRYIIENKQLIEQVNELQGKLTQIQEHLKKHPNYEVNVNRPKHSRGVLQARINLQQFWFGDLKKILEET